MIEADALFANAPFIEAVSSVYMDAVIRIKHNRLHIVKDALGLFKGRLADGDGDGKSKT